MPDDSQSAGVNSGVNWKRTGAIVGVVALLAVGTNAVVSDASDDGWDGPTIALDFDSDDEIGQELEARIEAEIDAEAQGAASFEAEMDRFEAEMERLGARMEEIGARMDDAEGAELRRLEREMEEVTKEMARVGVRMGGQAMREAFGG